MFFCHVIVSDECFNLTLSFDSINTIWIGHIYFYSMYSKQCCFFYFACAVLYWLFFYNYKMQYDTVKRCYLLAVLKYIESIQSVKYIDNNSNHLKMAWQNDFSRAYCVSNGKAIATVHGYRVLIEHSLKSFCAQNVVPTLQNRYV